MCHRLHITSAQAGVNFEPTNAWNWFTKKHWTTVVLFVACSFRGDVRWRFVDSGLYFASSSLLLIDNVDALLLIVVPMVNLQMQTTVSLVVECGARHVTGGVLSPPPSPLHIIGVPLLHWLLSSRGDFLLMNGCLLFVAMSSEESCSSFMAMIC